MPWLLDKVILEGILSWSFFLFWWSQLVLTWKFGVDSTFLRISLISVSLIYKLQLCYILQISSVISSAHCEHFLCHIWLSCALSQKLMAKQSLCLQFCFSDIIVFCSLKFMVSEVTVHIFCFFFLFVSANSISAICHFIGNGNLSSWVSVLYARF